MAALIRCRIAGRYDDLAAKRGVPADEVDDDEWAMRVNVSAGVYRSLMKRGLITNVPHRLTDAGRDLLSRILPTSTTKDDNS